MKFTQDASEKKYKNAYKAGGYKSPKKTVKVKKPTVNQIFIVAKKCKCKK